MGEVKLIKTSELVSNFDDLSLEQRVSVQERQYRKQLVNNKAPSNKTMDEIIEKQIKEMNKKQKEAKK